MRSLDRRLAAPVAYGFGLTFASSIGQTFLLSLFVPAVLAATALSAGTLAAIYSAATLLAALLLPPLGRMVDRMDLARYGLVVGVCTLAGAVLLALASHPALVFVAYVLLRLFGQGLLPHVAMTGVARFFADSRGKALAIVSLGYCAGEGLLPLLVAGLTEWVGWRWTFSSLGLAVGLLIVPLVTILIRTDERFRRLRADDAVEVQETAPGSRPTLFRSGRIWCYLPALVFPALSMTALLFLQTFIADSKRIDIVAFAAGFIGYALVQVPASMLFGAMIDRFGSRIVLILHLVPLAIGIALLAAATDVLAVWIFLALAGVTTAASAILRTSFVAELVPQTLLGGARSAIASLMTVASAVGAALYGWMLALGFEIGVLLWLTVGLAVAVLLPPIVLEVAKVPKRSAENTHSSDDRGRPAAGRGHGVRGAS